MKLFQDPTTTMPASKPGFVTVALGSKGAVALTGGTRLTWGEKLFGGYSSYYQVDTRRAAVTFPKINCGSSDHGVEFDVVVTLTVEVVDPARAVEKGMSEVEPQLAQPVRKVVEDEASQYDVRGMTAAKRAIEKALLNLRGLDRALRIIDASADVRPDQESKGYLREIGQEKLKIEAGRARHRVDSVKVEEIVKMLDDPDMLLAQSIVTNDDSFRQALEIKLNQYANDRERQHQLLQFLIDKGMIEQHDLHGRYAHLMEAALMALSPNRRSPTGGNLPAPDKDKS